MRSFLQELAPLIRLSTSCNWGVKGPVGAVDLLRQPARRLATSVVQLASTPVSEGQEGPTAHDGYPTAESAEPSSGRTIKDMDAQGVEVVGGPTVGKYQWNKERTEREIRRAKYARDENNRGEWQDRRSRMDSRQHQSRGHQGHSNGRWDASAGDRSPSRASVKLHHPICLTNFGRLASRRDVQRLLKDCNISTEDIRLHYDVHTLLPKAFYANMRTAETLQRALAYDGALIAGRPIKIVQVGIHEMQAAILSPIAMGSKGRFVMASGIQENANLEDIVRFFEGYELMGNPVTMMKKLDENGSASSESRNISQVSRGATPAHSSFIRALIRFATTEEAHRAMRMRQCCFLLNAPVTLRILH